MKIKDIKALKREITYIADII